MQNDTLPLQNDTHVDERTKVKKAIIESNLIVKITRRVQIREKAFFAIMRQTGLAPKTITRLRIENLEPNTTIPRRIDTKQESKKETKKPPYFIGEEADKYLRRYLATRRKVTPESLLFAAENNPNKEISTKNVSRAFRRALEKIEKENKQRYGMKSAEIEKAGKKRLTLFSLIEFYRENAKHYVNEIDNNPNENDEYFRKVYKEKALPFLEIESPIAYQKEILKLGSQIKEMKQTIARDSEYISSILTLLYNNRGDPQTGENEEIGDRFIDLWKEVRELQLKNLEDAWKSKGKIKLLPFLDIVEELTKTLKHLKKPYDELKRQTPRTAHKG